MEKNIISKLLLEYLYSKRQYPVQFFNQGCVPEDFVQFAKEKDNTIDISKDEIAFREVFWELVSRNLVVPGDNSRSCSGMLPWVSITKYGISCYEQGKILPYDTEYFLKSLYEKIPELDEIIKLYFDEAVSCFSNMNFLASTVMIGCALERTIVVITETFCNKLLQTEKPNYEKRVLNQSKIKTKFDNFLEFLKQKKFEASLNQSLKEKLNSFLPSVVHLVRITRNETGHPTGREIDRDEALANILLAKEGVLFFFDLLKKMI